MRRILLKISGEALGGSAGFGIEPQILAHAASEIRKVQDDGVQVALVIGGGNISAVPHCKKPDLIALLAIKWVCSQL